MSEAEKMLEQMDRLEEFSRRREDRDIEIYKMTMLGIKLRERQVKALEGLLVEMRRLRVTGIQP